MTMLDGAAGLLLILGVLWEAFETIVLPRRVTRRVRFTRLFYRSTWIPWSALARRAPLIGQRHEAFLAFFGPLSLLMLLIVWAAGLILGFALLQWAGGSAVQPMDGMSPFGADLYLSGTTFFTLGLGDVAPRTAVARALTVIEAGVGFGFLALVIGYLPVLYQSFSRREVNISLLDARAGSPPTAGELLRRHAGDGSLDALRQLLHEWERWSAELLETHLSYPVLAYFRSQHTNQSWLAALTTILDVTALVQSAVDAGGRREAQLTFAMARHAVGDLAQVFHAPPARAMPDRLPPLKLAQLPPGPRLQRAPGRRPPPHREHPGRVDLGRADAPRVRPPDQLHLAPGRRPPQSGLRIPSIRCSGRSSRSSCTGTTGVKTASTIVIAVGI
jgi:hypothetical protein